jgi:hypothetical protein
MYRRIVVTAALLAAGIISGAWRDRATDAALSRAWYDSDTGDYVAALTTYRELLAGAETAARV